MAIDLGDYTYGELKGLLFEVGNAIRMRERERVTQARARIEAIAADAGMPLDALLGPARQAVSGRPRYRNPADRTQTWTGRGRPPRWLKQALTDGKTLEDFANEDGS